MYCYLETGSDKISLLAKHFLSGSLSRERGALCFFNDTGQKRTKACSDFLTGDWKVIECKTQYRQSRNPVTLQRWGYGVTAFGSQIPQRRASRRKSPVKIR
jgi:hypothetical protein